MLSLLNIKQCQSGAAARKRAQVAAIDLGEEDMADSTKEEEKLHRKVRKLFQKWEKKEEKKNMYLPRKLPPAHKHLHRHKRKQTQSPCLRVKGNCSSPLYSHSSCQKWL